MSLLTLLLPEREGVKRAALTAFSLIFLLCLLPGGGDFALPDLFPSHSESEAVSGEVYEQTVKEQAILAVKDDLCRRFALQDNALALAGDVTLDGDGFTIHSLVLTLSGTGFFANVTSLLGYIEENYTKHCEVHFVGA